MDSCRPSSCDRSAIPSRAFVAGCDTRTTAARRCESVHSTRRALVDADTVAKMDRQEAAEREDAMWGRLATKPSVTIVPPENCSYLYDPRRFGLIWQVILIIAVGFVVGIVGVLITLRPLLLRITIQALCPTSRKSRITSWNPESSIPANGGNVALAWSDAFPSTRSKQSRSTGVRRTSHHRCPRHPFQSKRITRPLLRQRPPNRLPNRNRATSLETRSKPTNCPSSIFRTSPKRWTRWVGQSRPS
ncbi:hypothetical protein BLA18109_07474 [Burkholderia lata]|uniref:Uncharacterized protein n=1 Tax=Burkholderia lata (strain ATCC 17760 / DSM 23089 / LMG 22485 / NCIMB 9086 / R18194 / 383) TaxID=482957 RepID=A0A6P3A3M9_BURL3|nr:hypothetical protein BLA18109_07474 [Burkholderia lata]